MSHVDPSKSSSASPPSLKVRPQHEYTLDEVRSLLKGMGAKRSGSCRCPIHGDRNASASIKEGKDNALVFYCFKCVRTLGSKEAVFAEFIKFLQNPELRKDAAPDEPESTSYTHVATYTYTNADGTVFAEKERTVDEHSKKHFTWKRNGKLGLRGNKAPLYRLHEIQRKVSMFFPEGEKDVDTLREHGLAATCNPNGANEECLPAYVEQMIEAGVRRVAVLVDNDEDGRAHAQEFAAAFHAADIETRVVALPGLPEKGDVTDWLLLPGNTVEKLRAITKQTPVWAPSEESAVEVQDATAPEDEAAEENLIETVPFPRAAMVGLPHQFAELYRGKSDMPYPYLYVSFTTLFGAALSGDVSIRSGISDTLLALYVALIGASGHGRKSSSRSAAIDFFGRLAPPWHSHIYIPKSTPASNVGLIKEALKAGKRPLLLNVDEFSSLLQKSNISHATLVEDINTLFDMPSIGSTSKEFDQVAESVFLSILAGTTDKLWVKTFTSQAVQVGFLNRLFLVPAYRETTVENPQPIDEEALQPLLKAASTALSAVPRPMSFHGLPGEAGEIFTDWVRSHKAIEFAPVFARVDTYVRRLAAIFTVMGWSERPGDRPPISSEAVRVACALGNWQIETRRLAQPLDGDNEYALHEAEMRRYLSVWLRKAPGYVTQRDLRRRFKHWGGRATDWAIEALESNGEITVKPEKTKSGQETILIRESKIGLFTEHLAAAIREKAGIRTKVSVSPPAASGVTL